jgi:hypothetical protein
LIQPTPTNNSRLDKSNAIGNSMTRLTPQISPVAPLVYGRKFVTKLK